MTDTGADDTPPTREGLGARLRALREATRPLLNQTAAAAVIGASQNRLSRYESGDAVPTVDEARALCRAYGAPSQDVVRIVEAVRARQPKVTTHTALSRRGGSLRIQEVVDQLEDNAGHVRGLHPGMVLGALQTDDYARAVFAGGDPAALRSRLARIARARTDTGRRWTLVMTEGALLVNVAGSRAMAEQCEHIAAMSLRPNFDVRLLTHVQPTGGLGVRHGFTLYDDSAVIVGVTAATNVLSKAVDVRAHRQHFDQVANLAVRDDVAREHLARLAGLYREDPA